VVDGQREGTASTDRGLLILTAMKRFDQTRWLAAGFHRSNGGRDMGKFGFVACDVQGYNYADPAPDAFHKAIRKSP